jgi:hypothetical protein
MRLTDRSTRVPGAGLLRLYPRDWRERYEIEMLEVLGERPIGRRAMIDLLRGALDARLHPRTPPGIPVAAAVVAGVAWAVAGLVGVTQPAPPDWPGYLLETLPVGLIGAVAAMWVVLAVGRRSGLGPPRGTDLALALAIAGQAAWIVALAIAIVGGPYGAVTGAAQSFAAIGTLAVGLVRWRVDDQPSAAGLLVAGAAMLVPSPAAWFVASGAWFGVAVVGIVRTPLPISRA